MALFPATRFVDVLKDDGGGHVQAQRYGRLHDHEDERGNCER